MCGIAGIMFKNGGGADPAGRALIDMLDGCQHRGPDSTGFALYGDAVDGELLLRFFVGEGEEADRSIARIKGALHKHTARIVEDERVGSNYRVRATFNGDVRKLAYDVEHAAKVISIGSSLEIVKDVGSAHEVDDHYGVSGFHGTHGLGHVRLATESAVKPEAAHPFWATGFADVAIVHNGQITNYWKMRRRLEQRGNNGVRSRALCRSWVPARCLLGWQRRGRGVEGRSEDQDPRIERRQPSQALDAGDDRAYELRDARRIDQARGRSRRDLLVSPRELAVGTAPQGRRVNGNIS